MPRTKKDKSVKKAKKVKLSKEERSQIAKDRWAKIKAAKAQDKPNPVKEWVDEAVSDGLLSATPDTPSSSGRDENGVPSIVGLGDGTITPNGAFVPDQMPTAPPPAPPVAPVRVPKQKRTPVPKEFLVALKTADQRLAKAIEEYEDCQQRISYLSSAIPRLQRTVLALRNESNPDAIPAPSPYNFSGGVPNATAFQAPIDPQAALMAAMAAPPVSRASGGAVQFSPDVVGALEGPEDGDEDRFITGPHAGKDGWVGA